MQLYDMKDIFVDPEFNCRGDIAPFDVIELSRSIDLNGLLEPVVIQEYAKKEGYKFRLLMGHRRFKAFEILNRTQIPAVIRSDLSETQAMAVNLIENLERKNLNIMQEAKAIERFHTAGCKYKDVARIIGKSEAWVQIRYTALRLPKEIQNEIAAGYITQEQIKDIYNIPSMEQKFKAVREIKESRMRGEKRKIKVVDKKKIPLNVRRIRDTSELFRMQDKIRDVVGNNFGTRCIAWAAGIITEIELLNDLKDLAKEKGIPYELPPEFRLR